MGKYSRESLELLRQQVDLIELIGSYVTLKPSGSCYKGLCPFHEEKTPSFIVQRGESHYHCFGCGAHGDAIAFLMNCEKITFVEAIENLAGRFQVTLKRIEGEPEEKGPKKSALKEVLQVAMEFYHIYLLHTDEGHRALTYLYERGIDLAFIRTFKIGLAPEKRELFSSFMQKKKVRQELLVGAGLVQASREGGMRVFFADRLTFPILDYSGSPIGFSARLFKKSTFGPKYVNTPETSLFKKSSILYGLNFCRKRIAKEKHVLIVEGQIDALRLIQEGLTMTVAGQGTAFTDEHVKKLLQLGIERVYLALDGDHAGQEAAVKIGQLFQCEGIEVKVAALPDESDPDTFLRENGIKAFTELLEEAKDYIVFLIDYWSQGIDLKSPAQKNTLVQRVSEVIRRWEQPLLEHESLRQLSRLVEIPEKFLNLKKPTVEPRAFVPRKLSVQEGEVVNPDRTLEIDLLRWLFLEGQAKECLVEMIADNLKPEHFYVPICRELFSRYLTSWKENKVIDLSLFFKKLEGPEEKLVVSEIVKKHIDRRRAMEGALDTVKELLDRHWLWECEKINLEIRSGQCAEEDMLELAKTFSTLRRNPPKVMLKEEEL